MILEEETFEAFGYYPSKLKPKSGKSVLAACDKCSKIRVTTKHAYCSLCLSCVQKGKKSSFLGKHHTKESKALLSAVQKGRKHSKEQNAQHSKAMKGKNNPNFEKHPSKKTRELMSTKQKGNTSALGCKHTEEDNAAQSVRTKGKYCGILNPAWNGGKKAANARHHAKRDRELGYTLLMPLAKDDVGHHITDKYVIGISKEIHQSFGGRSRKKHRALVLDWLKTNDKKKYKIAIAFITSHVSKAFVQVHL